MAEAVWTMPKTWFLVTKGLKCHHQARHLHGASVVSAVQCKHKKKTNVVENDNVSLHTSCFGTFASTGKSFL